MLSETLKVHQMAVCLQEREPDTRRAGEQQQGIANIFNLFWDKLVHILSSSLQKVSELYTYLFGVIAQRLPTFLQQITEFWRAVLTEIGASHPCALSLKLDLFESVAVLEKEFLLQFAAQ
jgi:hypothetical protein